MGRTPMERSCCVCLNMGTDFNKLTKKDDKKISLLTKFKMCIWEVLWIPSFYICLKCTKTLDIVHTFREQCIKSDLIRKRQDDVTNEWRNDCYYKETSTEIKTEDTKETMKLDDDDDSDICLSDLVKVSQAEEPICSSNTEDDTCLQNNENATRKIRSRKSKLKQLVDPKSCERLDSRMARRKRKRKFTCEKCHKCFLTSTKLVNHCIKEHEMEIKNIKPFGCDRCPQRFSTSSNLWQHVKYHDGIKSNICSYCGKGFVTKTDLLNHEKKHLNMREYKCDLCGKSFNTHKDIRSHRLIVHTDSSNWKYVCEICTKPFPIKSNYDSHMRRHTGDKKFACHLCEKKFTTKCDLQRHTRSHSDIREYRCAHCEKEYKDERVLKMHMAKAHGIGVEKVKIPVRSRNYVCHYCSKAYYAKNKLTRHLYTHSGEKPFDCPVCHKKFNDKSYVKQHLKNTHNIVNIDEHGKAL